jgi:hypothetical protein
LPEKDALFLDKLHFTETTFNYYEAKMAQNPEGYCCWEGMK